MKIWVQQWEESERGWGVRPDGYSIHLTKDDAIAYISTYWQTQPQQIPDEYSCPSGEPYEVTISDVVLTIDEVNEQLMNGSHGIRYFNMDYPNLTWKPCRKIEKPVEQIIAEEGPPADPLPSNEDKNNGLQSLMEIANFFLENLDIVYEANFTSSVSNELWFKFGVECFLAGLENKLPDVWKDYVEVYKKRTDPEWKEYMRLKDKFKE